MRDLFAAMYAFPINQSLSVYHLRESAACKGDDQIVTRSIFDIANRKSEVIEKKNKIF